MTMRRFTSPLVAIASLLAVATATSADDRLVPLRGIYGGWGDEIAARGKTLADYGINAVWVGSDGLDRERIAQLHSQGVKVFAEFNTLHVAQYVKEHPDAAPVGVDGGPAPPPDEWQGVCPTHPGYRATRMDAFRKALADFPIDGIWLDYHHAHASWEQAIPSLPDTCFCPRCLLQFSRETATPLPRLPTPALIQHLLNEKRDRWVAWRCGVFTDWVREFREIRDATRPAALLGTFHCPWSDLDFDGALRDKLAIDLRAQAPYLDVLSPMPYQARFGHADDPAWISRQTAWLGQHLGLKGAAGERLRIWPIVQLSDWGEAVQADQVAAILDHGTRPPATGVTIFAWGSLVPQWDKVEELGRAYRGLQAPR
jgi:hypothetical protein